MRHAWTPKFQLSGPTVHSYTVTIVSAGRMLSLSAFVLFLKVSSHTSAMLTTQGCGVQSPPLEIDSIYSLAFSIFIDIMSA